MGTCRKFVRKGCTWLAAMSLLAIVPSVYAQVDPAACSTTGVTLTMGVFAEPGHISIPGGNAVINGESISYNVTITFPGGVTCAFSGGTLTLTTPDGVVHDVSTGGTSSPAGATTTTAACWGCTSPHAPSTTDVTSFTSAFVPYTVSLADFLPAACVPGSGTPCHVAASTNFTAALLYDASPADTSQPTGSTGISRPALACGAVIDKQVSCDGGTSFQDVTGIDDATGSSTLGCVAPVGGNIIVQYVAKNTGGAAIACTLGDNKITIPAGKSAVSLAGLNSTTTVDVNTACTEANGANEPNTATLGSCTCTDAQGTAVSGPTTTDTATFACCGVAVDKQISCDGGTTFNDVGLETSNQDGTNGCIGTVGANVQAQWFASNTGNVPVTCTLGDTNTLLLPSQQTGIALASGAGQTLITQSTLQECSAAHAGETPGDMDTATLNCACTAPTGLVNKAGPQVATDSATFECCGVSVDKQVSCNGGAFVDTGFETTNQDGTNFCTAIDGQPVAIQYFAKNTGTLPLNCSASSLPAQGLEDVQVSVGVPGGIIFGPASETLTVGQTIGPIANTNITTCSSTLNTNEATGNKAEIDCTCNGSASLGANVSVAAFDIAQIKCATPNFGVSKTCTFNSGTGQFDVGVNIDNTGATDLSCQITDNFFTGGCTTPPIGGTPAGSVTVSPDPILAAAGTPTNGATGNFSSAVTVCNQATAVCTAGAGSPGAVVLPTQFATALCAPPGAGCFTRTPGYWATHPQVTQQVLDTQPSDTLQSCGIGLTNEAPEVPGSTSEDLCESGKDFKNNNTSPQQLQLIRQCTAAALNLAVSNNPAAPFNCEAADPGITANFNSCCGPSGSVCDSGATPSVINASTCIGILDAFNNQFDTTDFPAWLVNSSAEPADCRAANGNGFVNPGRALGPAK